MGNKARMFTNRSHVQMPKATVSQENGVDTRALRQTLDPLQGCIRKP
jgi:hypothetical protein